MGLLDGVLGGLVGAGINEMIQRHGGVQGLVNQFEQKGLGGIAHSCGWARDPISLYPRISCYMCSVRTMLRSSPAN